MSQGTAVSYRVFVRNWWRWEWKPAPSYGETRKGNRALVPDPGARKTTLATRCTEEEARAMCRAYQASHKPGPLSRKAEYERE
jgi:hypothetical protein